MINMIVDLVSLKKSQALEIRDAEPWKFQTAPAPAPAPEKKIGSGSGSGSG